MIIRNARFTDSSRIKKLLRSSFTPIYAYYAMKSFATLDHALVASTSKDIIGVLNWRIFKFGTFKIGYLFWLAVDPMHRRKGIAKRLTKKAIRSIKTQPGDIPIYTAVEKDNQFSKKLLDNLGFRKMARSELKERFPKHLPEIRRQMMLMPWEELYVTGDVSWKLENS